MEIPEISKLPEPNSSTFGQDAYDFAKWMKQAAPAFNGLRTELLDALNASLLGATSTSTSSITIASTGTININVEANKGYTVGMIVKIASVANPANYVKGTVTAYTSATGAMSVLLFSKGGSGTYTSWSVFFDVPDSTILSVPTGEAVPAGSLLAIDDAGNSMTVDSVAHATLQAVTATSLFALPLANGNTAIFWTAGSTDYRMMIINKAGGTVLASTSIATAANSGKIFAAELTNGNIVITYSQSSQPCFKVINTLGAPVVAETVIEAVALYGPDIKCCALNGGFAVTYNTSASNRYAVYTNAGGVAKVPTNGVAGASLLNVSICKTAAAGFVVLAGTNSLAGFIYDGNGTSIATCALAIPVHHNAGITAKSGSVVGAGRMLGTPKYGPTLHLASDTTNADINGGGLIPTFEDPMPYNSSLGVTDVAVLGDGNYIATYAITGSSTEYPRYIIFNSDGQFVRSGICLRETTYQGYPVYVIPKDTNGFSLIWLNTNRNIRFAQVKSGKLVGVSLGQVGTTHQYLESGSVSLSSKSMLNVGGTKINYSHRSNVVTI